MSFTQVAKQSLAFAGKMSARMMSEKIDPAKLVVVCISGYSPWSSMTPVEREELKIRFLAREIERLDEKIAEMRTEGNERQVEEIRQQVVSDLIENGAARIEKMVGQFGSGGTGMEDLRNKIADNDELRRLGINPGHILYRKWSERMPWYWDLEPVYTDLKNDINKMKPGYLAIIGHSYGGCTAARLSRVTDKKPGLVCLIDPVFAPADTGDDWKCRKWPPPFCEGTPYIRSKPQDHHDDNFPRGDRVRSYFQYKTEPCGFRPVKNSEKEEIENIHVDDVSHTTIDDDKGVHEYVLNHVLDVARGHRVHVGDEKGASRNKGCSSSRNLS